MRILCTEADLLFIRKSAKLLCKFCPATDYKHTAAMDKFASWLGFFDYKQLKRNLVDTPIVLPSKKLSELEETIISDLSLTLMTFEQARHLTSTFSLGRLSAFSYKPSNLPIVISQSNYNNQDDKTHPKGFIVDEFFVTFKNHNQRDDSADLVIQAFEHTGLEQSQWFIPYDCTDISKPSVVIFERLVSLLKPLLEEGGQFNGLLPAQWSESTKSDFRNEVKKLWFQAMVSAREAVSTDTYNIKPYGLSIVCGKASSGNGIAYGAYNSSIHVCLPDFWDSLELAEEALAHLLLGTTVDTNCSTLNGSFEFSNNWTVSLRNGKNTLAPFDFEAIKFPVCATIDLSEGLDEVSEKPLTLPLNANSEAVKIYREPSPSNSSPWINNEQHEVVNNLANRIERTAFQAMIMLDKDKNISKLIELIKDQVSSLYEPQLNDCDGYLFDIDNVEQFKKAFPDIHSSFNDFTIDYWHEICSTYTGFPRKTCGQISSSQSEMLCYALHEILTGEPCEYEYDTQIAAIVAANFLEKPNLTLNDLLNQHKQLRALHQYIYKVRSTLVRYNEKM